MNDLSVHDNSVYAYTVDCQGCRLTLHTEYRHHEFTDVVFRDVLAHQFEHVLQGNILFDIQETDVAAFVAENKGLLAESWRYGWPPVEYHGDLDVLTALLKGSSVRAYTIGSSYGLSGWVLAGSCERVRRSEQASVT